MQTNQKIVTVQSQRWTLSECQKVQALWVTEKGCQRCRNEAAYGAHAFQLLKDFPAALSKFSETKKIRRIFMCGDCPKYGEPVEYFDTVVNHTLELRKEALRYLEGVTFDMEDAEEVKQEDLSGLWQGMMDRVYTETSNEEIEPLEGDVL